MAMVLPMVAFAQKPKTVEFTADGLPDQLLEYLNKSTSDGDRQKENNKTVKAFRASYGAMEPTMQERAVAVYNYAVRAKLRGNPEITSLCAAMTAFSTAPGGAQNFDQWMHVIESFSNRNAKGKVLTEWVSFSSTLLSERVLYRSNSSVWQFDPKTPFRIALEDGTVWIYIDQPADLSYSSAKDLEHIRATRGRYNYKDNLWIGEGGRLDWTRTGLGAEACYAELAAYRAETKSPKFTADSVRFVNTHYFSQPIMGRVEELLSTPMDAGKYSYPRFRSYQRDFVLPDIMPGVDYSGSFMMNGSKFITASSKHPANLVFRRDGHPQMVVSSLKFTLTPERLSAENASVVFYLGTDDSISNTGVTVRYTPADHRVSIVNDPKRNYYSPFIDTYHDLDIYCALITWRTDGTDLEFSNLTAGGSVSMATFESSNYYTYRKYREIQGIDEVSPVRRVYEYSEGGNNEFSAKAFSNYIGLDEGQTLLMIHNLCRHGLVSYNEITGRVRVKDKLGDYMRAFTKKKGFDYDALSLESTAGGNNAHMSIDDRALVISGVDQFVVSDSQRVVVYPDKARGSQVIVGHNRSIHFDGRIEAGKFVFFVDNCDFSYEDFRFEMPSIHKLYFAVENFTDPDSLHPVMTPLSNLVGSLRVDEPDNHCGLVDNKDFPIFESRENSYVYYDQKNIRGGQYNKEKFYYTLHPFVLNDLVNFVTDSLQFNGVLTSAGIFPDITYPLTVQRDYYLGFRTETPAGGYPAYGGKGTYRSAISLDHYGLQGEGELDYLTSHTTSQKYLFLPDSTVATTDTFLVREEKGYPDVKGGRTSLHWLPYADSMAVATLAKGRPLSMYRGDALLTGRFDLMPKGSAASGVAVVHEGTLESDRFLLASRQMDAEVSSFTLNSNKLNAVAFTARGVRSHVDYDERHADLQLPSGPARTELQLVKLEAYADMFSWDMDRKVLDIVNTQRPSGEGLDGLDLRQRVGKLHDMPGVRFVSTDAAQQGFAYHSLRSTYRYEDGNLSSGGVYVLAVADAAIAPTYDTVHIERGGHMRQLVNASLIFDREHAWHYLTGAEVIVSGANSYTGKGFMDYRNDTDKAQRLYFDNISVDGRGVSIARGNIGDEASFLLSSAFGFAGKVRAEGDHQWLHFEGGVRLVQPCIPQEQLALLSYSGYTDPEHVHVTVPEQPVDWQGNRLTASVMMDKNSLRPTAAFLTKEKSVEGELLAAHGVLTYLGDRQQYMIASEQKVENPDGVVAPYLALNTEDCTVEGEGPMTFNLRNTQASFFSYGTAAVGIRSADHDELATVFGFTFPIDGAVVNAMRDALKDDLRLNPAGASTNAEMRHALMYLLGADKGAGAYAAYSATGQMASVPKAMQSTVLFDNIRWQYLPTVGLYYDGKVGLVAMGDKPLGVELRLKAQIVKHSGKQEMVFYIEAAKDHWYFFRYDLAASELTLYSSSGTWLDMVKAIPLDQRKIEKEGMPLFRYFVGNNSSEVQNWLNWFSKTLYPGD